MFRKPVEKTVEYLVKRAKEYASGCGKVYVSFSGGVDSAVVAMILTLAFGKENVVCVFRDIRSNPIHGDDSRALAKTFGFRLLYFDLNSIYDQLIKMFREEFLANGLLWMTEGEEKNGVNWTNAYASLKSRATTPLAGFVSKAIDQGNGRIFGTGNIEEDLLLRYYDKSGDGAVDNNILVGLTKMEVRQIALWFAKKYDAPICQKIAEKIPSADLQANGDVHNDESELSALARSLGLCIALSYGTCYEEGNIAWITKQDLDLGVVRGEKAEWDSERLVSELGYSDEQAQLAHFMRIMEKRTRHKDLGIPGVTRSELRGEGLVD